MALQNQFGNLALDASFQNVFTAATTLGAANAYAQVVSGSRDTLFVLVNGTFSGTISLQGLPDGTTVGTVAGPATWLNLNTGAVSSTITAAGAYQATISGFNTTRVTMTAYTSGSASVLISASDGNAAVALDAPLPPGTNALGSVTVASTTLTAVTPGTAAANLGKAEDTVAGSGDTGVAFWGVRADTPSAATTDTNGDYSQLSVDNSGQLWTKPGAPKATDPGLVPYRAAAVTSAVVVKASAGRIRRIRVYNPNTSVAFLQVLNTAASPALNTNLIEEFVIPASTTYAENIDIPTTMSTGISIGASTTSGGTTVVTTGLNVQIWYV
jgi:hypothetical protein